MPKAHCQLYTLAHKPLLPGLLSLRSKKDSCVVPQPWGKLVNHHHQQQQHHHKQQHHQNMAQASAFVPRRSWPLCLLKASFPMHSSELGRRRISNKSYRRRPAPLHSSEVGRCRSSSKPKVACFWHQRQIEGCVPTGTRNY